MSKLLVMAPRTYEARLFRVEWERKEFAVAGTLDGFIDLAVPGGGTYPLTPDQTCNLAEALLAAVEDVQTNCRYEQDPLLK